MKTLALVALLAAVCFAEAPRKPACTARNRGQFWPAEANTSATAARELVQRGDLEICSLAVWKYKWEHVSVNVRDLAKRSQPLSSESRKAGAEEGR